MFQRSYKKLLVAIITLVVMTTNLSARWAEYSECNLEIITYKRDIKVNADGSSEEIVEYRIKALNKSGRGALANFSIAYDKVFTDIDVLAAHTITNGSKYVVTEDLISTRTTLDYRMRFEDKHETLIRFPNVEVGSEVQLSLKYKNRALFQNHYCDVENYNHKIDDISKIGSYYGSDCIKNSYCKITSEIPLYIKVNDPHNVLSIKTNAKSEQGSFNAAEITLNKPLVTRTTNEPRYNVIMPDEYLTWVSVSSFNKWEDYSESYDYFAALAQKLPQMFADITHEAKNYTNEEAQISFVMSAIIDKVKYKSNVRTIERSLLPRELQEIASTQVGDCMELSISTGAILQKLGYTAYPALVYRIYEYCLYEEDGLYKEKPYLPSPYHFNHAIIKVVGKAGKVYWLDPTDVIVSVDRPLPNIADKMALVFTGSQTASYEYIPPVNYDYAKVIEELVLVKYDGDNNIASFQGKNTYKGEQSLKIIRELYELRHSPQKVNDHLFFKVTSDRFFRANVHKKHMALLTKIKLRLLQDIAIEYEYDLSNAICNSNLGKIFVIPSLDILINPITSAILDQVGDIVLCSHPYTLIQKFVIKGQKIKNVSNLNCKINTSWVDIERVCQYVDDDTEIVTTIKYYQRIIKSADLKTQEYKMLEEKVKVNTAIVLE